MLKTTSNIICKLTAVFLTLVIAVGLLPAPALAAEKNLPDWYFLFAIFKNVDADVTDKDGKTAQINYVMHQEEVDYIKEGAQGFEEFMNSLGVMRAHVDLVEVDTPVTELEVYDLNSNIGSYFTSQQSASLLRGKVDLNRYDFVTAVVSQDVDTGYIGISTGEYGNGAGHSCINFMNWEYRQARIISDPIGWHPSVYVHEFLHFMAKLSARWGRNFDLHKNGDLYNTGGVDSWKGYYTDTILNRAKGEYGTGVAPEAWQYPPHVFRTADGTFKWTIPSGVSKIECWAFSKCDALTEITIPGSIISIEPAAFANCINLSEVTICPGVTRIEDQVFFGCTALTKIYIPDSITSIRETTFYKTSLKDVYYGGTEAQWKAIKIGEHNGDLTKAKIHYNSTIETPATAVTFTDVPDDAWYAEPVAWAVAKGITSGTSATTFSPGTFCTTAQILTFLWRSQGSPNPAGANPFSDVKDSDYYYNAAVWAHERGLISYNALQGNRPCTRSDVVTYLWKLAGSPEAKAASFTDVSSGTYYAQAVNWAVEQGITAGTSDTTFSPLKACTRGQIVTFLYRAFAKQ